MTTITIPRSREDMITRLTGIQRLLTATQWEKAAILAAFVTLPGSGSHNKQNLKNEVLSPERFTKLGIAGLRSAQTVRAYVRRWIATTRPIPQPGDEVNLDGLPDWETEAEVSAETKTTSRSGSTPSGPPLTPQQHKAAIEELDAGIERAKITGPVDRSELDAMDRAKEARKHTLDLVWRANHCLGEASDCWLENKELLNQDDRDSALGAIRAIEGHLAVLRMHLTEDIIGEVLRHDQPR